MRELRNKIWEALLSALPITAIVYLVSLLPWFNFTTTELITFSVGAVLLILGIGLFAQVVYSLVLFHLREPFVEDGLGILASGCTRF